VHLERELLALGAQRALVLCSPEQHALGASVVEQLGSHSAGLFDRAAMHGPLELAAEAQTVEASLGAH
jgi:maleylacetate reductase